MILIWFLLPLVLLLGICARRGAESHAKPLGELYRPAVLVWLAAAIPVVVISHLCSGSAAFRWPGSSEVAWVGIETRAARDTLRIGGRVDDAVIGWPDRSFRPRLTVIPEGSDTAFVDIRDGSGFIRRGKDDFLNGTVLLRKAPITLGSFSVQLVKRWFWLSPRLQVLNRSGSRVLETKGLRKPASRQTVFGMRSRIGTTVVRLRAEGGDAGDSLALTLEGWADSITVLVTLGGRVRVLTRSDAARASVELPAKLALHTATRVQQLELRDAGGQRISLSFPPPWRLATPFPQVSEFDRGGPRVLTVTGQALPGDRAFVLPIGGGIVDPRARVVVDWSRSDLPRLLPQEETTPNRGGVLVTAAAPKIPEGSVTSLLHVPAGNVDLLIASASDLPRPIVLRTLLFGAWVILLLGLLVLAPRMQDTDYWVLSGLVLAAWCFLCFRLLLAFRYSLDPDTIDRLSVKGVTLAFLGLAVVPGLIAIAARFHRDRFDDEEQRRLQAPRLGTYMLIVVAAAVLVPFLVPAMWPNLPVAYRVLRDRTAIGFLGTAILFLGMYWQLQYVRRLDGNELRSNLYVRLIRRLQFMDWVRDRDGAEGVWGRICERRGNPPVVIAVMGAVLLALLALGKLFGSTKTIQELAIPAFLCWLPAFVLLASILGGRRREVTVSKMTMVYMSVTLVMATVFLVPIACGDSGGVVSTFSVFIPLAALLLVGRSWRPLLVVLLGLAIPAALMVHLAKNPDQLPERVQRMRPAARVMAYQAGDSLQRFLPQASAGTIVSQGGLPLRGLKDALEHGWENRAMAHEGGRLGLGFNQAPTRRSRIPQQVIQYDSVYSFFVLGEYGLLGGLALLVLYAAPFVLILFSARLRFDLGHGVALLIASSFLLEALFHAAMNLGMLPFTGRNLPFLSVNSTTDLARWTIFFVIMSQAVLWRSEGRGSGFTARAPSLLSGAEGHPPVPEPALAFLTAGLVFAMAPLLLGSAVIRRDARIVAAHEEYLSFTWGTMLKEVGAMIADSLVRVEAGTRKLWIDPDRARERGFKRTGWTCLEQEVDRFNPMGPDDKLLGCVPSVYSWFGSTLTKTRNIRDFDAMMRRLRDIDGGTLSGTRSLFKLEFHDGNESEGRTALSDSSRNGPRCVLSVNREYDQRVSFRVGCEPKVIPTVRVGDGQALVGPAWVRGRWMAVYDTDPDYPWAAHLAGAIEEEGRLRAERKKPGGFLKRPSDSQDLQERFGMLTIDSALQHATQAFCRGMGRGYWERKLPTSARLRYAHAEDRVTAHLPIRSAIAILSLPKGEVLALGGWPRMSSSRFWTKEGDDWIPPIAWTEGDAPHSIRLRYQVDRNFDPLVVGSSSKPLWAAAALTVHPGLDEHLWTSGGAGVETEIFGMDLLGDGWSVKNHGWVDWEHYLSLSDNRYQVRVGFLGLADEWRADVADAGWSPSDLESMDGPGRPWHQYPSFPDSVVKRKVLRVGDPPQITKLSRVDRTPLAQQLRDMFGLEVDGGVRGYRHSFWTKDESCDAPRRQGTPGDTLRSGDVNPDFDAISAPVTDLSLASDLFPRRYVSILLGGGTNLWANVEFAAAFGACVLGKPVLAHIVDNEEDVRFAAFRTPDFSKISARITPGLEGAVDDGTAARGLGPAKAFLESLEGVKCYAKTGTLGTSDGPDETSRVTIALIRPGKRHLLQSSKPRGLVISVVVERAEQGYATEALGKFLVGNRASIRRALGYGER